MQKKNANEILIYIIQLFTTYLHELSEVLEEEPDNQFAYGEKTAYTECLEILSLWEYAKDNGLKENLEMLFPL